MSRRNINYAVLLITSVIVAACSQPMAPRNDGTCKSYEIGTGRCLD
ncbi:MAG TPA: hypothetical protein VKH19_16940 [Gemmatimonadaceae bacterium]|nr:hypothetical protein [Gemmatimonadaceae bacterium]